MYQRSRDGGGGRADQHHHDQPPPLAVRPAGQAGAQPCPLFEQQPEGCRADAGEHPDRAAATTNPIRLSGPSPSASTGCLVGRCHPVSMLRRTSRQPSRSSSCTCIAYRRNLGGRSRGPIRHPAGGRFCRKASMPSRASSETNSRADSAPSRSASRSNPSRIAAVVSALDAARPCGEPRPMSATSAATAASTSSAAIVISPIAAAVGGVERLAGQVVAARRRARTSSAAASAR